MKSKLKYGFCVLLFSMIILSSVDIYGQKPLRRQRRNRTETTTNTNRTNTNNSNRNNSNSGRSSNSGNNRRQSQQTTQPTQPAVLQSQQTTQPTPSKPTTGYINGHEWVDLGLPSGLKWATCNIGASSPSDYGNYYAWGETTAKSSYDLANSKTYKKNLPDIGGNSSYDAARANWGSSWRLPTQSEFEELLNNCTWTWTTQGGHNGYKVKSKKNGNSIFLPAAGHLLGSTLFDAGDWSYYWSSAPKSSYTEEAYILYFNNGDHYSSYVNRSFGHSVRAVSE